MTSASSSRWPASNHSEDFVPVELSDLSHFVELSQFSATNGAAKADKGAAYLFADKNGAADDMMNTMLDVGGAIDNLEVAKGGVDQLPPASLQQFLKAANRKGEKLPGVVITEHKVYWDCVEQIVTKCKGEDKLVSKRRSLDHKGLINIFSICDSWFQDNFTNKYYNSFLDTSAKIVVRKNLVGKF